METMLSWSITDKNLVQIRATLFHAITVFSPAKIEGIGEGIILGGASVHIKDFGSTPIPLQRQISTEGMGAPYP